MTTEQSDIIKSISDKVEKHLAREGSGHDWWHIQRVMVNARKIMPTVKADAFIVELAVLLHDVNDYKVTDGNTDEGTTLIKSWLRESSVDEEHISEILDIIATTSFSGNIDSIQELSIEAKVLMDADRLDAIGAIGIARTFAYGGKKNRLIYDPAIPPVKEHTKESYRKSTAPTINHFYEKLLLLKDLMQTETGKALAQERHAYMEGFLKQFYAEVDPEKIEKE